MEYIKAFAPLLILILFFLGIGFYYSKKINKHAQKLVPDNTRPPDSLTLIRGLEYTNYTRAYTVIIDGAKAAEISSGETCHIPLSNGVHQISLKIDWCKSEELEFELQKGTNLTMHCGATYNNWKANFMVFFKPHRWLYVRVA
jgi:hypothetical protein